MIPGSFRTLRSTILRTRSAPAAIGQTLALPEEALKTVAPEEIVAATQAWIEKAVIGLDLCPFAKAVYVKQQIRYAISQAETPEGPAGRPRR